jgi:hypothetical protein
MSSYPVSVALGNRNPVLHLEKSLQTSALDVPKSSISPLQIGREKAAHGQNRSPRRFTSQTGFFSASSIDGQGNYGYYPAPRTDRRKRLFYA